MNQSPTTLYDCLSVLQALDELAEANDGNLPEDATQALVLAHTTSLDKLQRLVGGIKWMEKEAAYCKSEIDRIQARKKSFENRLASIKKFLTPYVQAEKKRTGNNVTVGTVTLGTRKSQSVELIEGFSDIRYGKNKTTFQADKKKIKEELKANPDIVILGAELVSKVNLSIK